jgi:hypothetical protein
MIITSTTTTSTTITGRSVVVLNSGVPGTTGTSNTRKQLLGVPGTIYWYT